MAHIYTPDNPYQFPYRIERVMFDNDNTLFEEPKWSRELHGLAAYFAAKNYFPDLKRADFIEMMVESRRKTGASLDGIAAAYNLNEEQFRQFQYDHLEKLTQRGFFTPNEDLIRGLETLRNEGIPVYMLTHGNLNWAQFTSNEMKIEDHFNEHNIFTKDIVPVNKNKGVDMFEYALDRAGVSPNLIHPERRGEGTVMVEDTEKNLEFSDFLGIDGIIICPENEMDRDFPDYVEVVVPNVVEAIYCVLDSNRLFEAHLLRKCEFSALEN